MGCVPSFLFKPEDFKDIPFYDESINEKKQCTITVHKDLEANSYMVIPPRLMTTFRNRQARVSKAFPEPLNELICSFKSIEKGISRLKAKSDKDLIERKGKGQLTYLKMIKWEKTLLDEINARGLKKAGFQELEIWNFVYFIVCTMTRLEQKRLPIDRLSFEDIVIFDKKFQLLYRPMFSQTQILSSTKEAKSHNREFFQEHFKQFKALILCLSLMTVPLETVLKIFDMEESREIFTKLHEIVWVKFYPKDTKSKRRINSLFNFRGQGQNQKVPFEARKSGYVLQ